MLARNTACDRIEKSTTNDGASSSIFCYIQCISIILTGESALRCGVLWIVYRWYGGGVGGGIQLSVQ